MGALRLDHHSEVCETTSRISRPTLRLVSGQKLLQEDPHPGEIDDPGTFINRYKYANNAPSDFTDPTGQFAAFLIPIVFGLGVETVAATVEFASTGKWNWTTFAKYAIGGTAFLSGAFAAMQATLALGLSGAAKIVVGTIIGAWTGALIGAVSFELNHIGTGEEGARFGAFWGGQGGLFISAWFTRLWPRAPILERATIATGKLFAHPLATFWRQEFFSGNFGRNTRNF